MSRRFLLLVSALILCAPAGAQSIQSPSEFLGYELGSRFTPHHRVVDYYQYLNRTSDRVLVRQYGETYEGRPLLAAYVGTPPHLSRLEHIREQNLALATGKLETPQADQPALVWLSYNVHGNESVSTEASMATIYELIRPGNAQTAQWLENTVVVIDPCINPDGRDRYVNWYNQMVGFRPNANPDAREHSEPWPGGRTNHYNFDLNRDWSWQTQKETQARLELYNAWLPQVHVDFHEQGVDSPYYFAPAAEPYHPAITDWQRAFQDSVGTNHTRYFDREGWLYFTREVFDLFYPGYGDTYPIYNGAIGMTYEQGGSGRAGLAIETAEKDTLTLGDRLAHHYTTGVSTVETASRNARKLLQEFGRFHREASTNPEGTYRTFVMKAASGGQRLRALAGHLDRLGIEFGSVRTSMGVSGRDYWTGKTSQGRVEPGDLVISVYQPKGVLARVLLEPEGSIPDSLTYDITAWALPYAYGMKALATTERITPDAAFSTVSDNPAPEEAEPYALALRWDAPSDVAFLGDVLSAGINARVATKPFRVGGSRFEAGTVLFTAAGNKKGFVRELRERAARHGVELSTMASGRVEEGSDLGSGSVRFISAPRVGVATGPSVSSGAAGEIWHWFEQELAYPVAMLEIDDLRRSDLARYDVLILPSGSYGALLSGAFLENLTAWVRDGGRLIALEGALGSLAGKEGFELATAEKKDEESGEKEEEDRLRAYGDRTRASLTDDVAGAVFRTRVDHSHPLGFGLSAQYFTLRRTSQDYPYLKRGWNVGVIERGSLVSGTVGFRALPKIEEVLAFGVQEMGRGAVVYLVDDPIFRGFWHEGRLLLGNAVFMPIR